MNRRQASIGILLGGALALTLHAQDGTPTGHATLVVGTFDSRAIAVAYARSGTFHDYLATERARLEEAKATGDEDLVEELEAMGPALQRRLHQQAFSTAPVDDIIARIEDRLPKLAKEAGVDVIVSKWVLSYRSPSAKFVDLSEPLAAEFEPDKDTLAIIHQLLETDPIPRGELEDHAD